MCLSLILNHISNNYLIAQKSSDWFLTFTENHNDNGEKMEIYYDNAVIIETAQNRILIDPDKKCTENNVDYVFVTHPHSDHYAGIWNLHAPIKVMNFLTYEIILFRNSQKQLPNVKFISDTLSFDGFQVRSSPSGHTIGSNQYEFTVNDQRVVCTGDFCLQSRIGIERCEVIPHPDVLIIDSTYGSKDYLFPDRVIIYKKLIKWIHDVRARGMCPIISARIIGTAQELTKLLNVAEGHFEVYAHPTICHINGIFQKYADLGSTKKRLLEEIAGRSRSVFIKPFWGDEPATNENLALCSGWLINDTRERTFPLSNHAGFDQILAYVKASKPRKIFTAYGNAEPMARTLQKEGYDAQPL